MPPGTLFVVATPIGNLEDITLRALRVLREADLIAAEDTRRTTRLLAHYGIETRTLSFHAHNVRSRLPQLLARMREGARVAVVSDAGTPGVSDPGVELVQAAVAEGIPVDPIPGASAPLVAAVGSGFPLVPLTILGFAPSRASDRRRWLEAISTLSHTCVLFESPQRIAETLSDIGTTMGERPIVVARELTKVHQEFVRGIPPELASRFARAKGEFCIVIGPMPEDEAQKLDVPDREIAAMFGRIAEGGAPSRRAVVAAVARRLGKSPREVYAAVERHKISGK